MVELLAEGVCVLLLLGWGVSHMSQLSSMSMRFDSACSFFSLGILSACLFLLLLFLLVVVVLDADFCPGTSTPNSLQNDVEMSVDVVSLPDLAAPAPAPLSLVDAADDEVDLALLPASAGRSLALGVTLRSVLRAGRWAVDAGGTVLDSVALIPSSPTVACLISSRNVQKPSFRSDAICLPVRRSASPEEVGGMDRRHCAMLELTAEALAAVASQLRSMDGRVADRGVLPMRWPSGLALLFSPSRDCLFRSCESRDSVRVCREPWNTLRPLAEMEVPPSPGKFRRRFCRSSSLLILFCAIDGEVTPDLSAEPSPDCSSGDRSALRASTLMLMSVLFLVFSANAHCFFRVASSDSARCSSSRSSRTLRSWAAMAVRKS